jgi:hypothetical protein
MVPIDRAAVDPSDLIAEAILAEGLAEVFGSYDLGDESRESQTERLTAVARQLLARLSDSGLTLSLQRP